MDAGACATDGSRSKRMCQVRRCGLVMAQTCSRTSMRIANCKSLELGQVSLAILDDVEGVNIYA
eukprot:3534525-Amphidinium_carterae.1